MPTSPSHSTPISHKESSSSPGTPCPAPPVHSHLLPPSHLRNKSANAPTFSIVVSTMWCENKSFDLDPPVSTLALATALLCEINTSNTELLACGLCPREQRTIATHTPHARNSSLETKRLSHKKGLFSKVFKNEPRTRKDRHWEHMRFADILPSCLQFSLHWSLHGLLHWRQISCLQT